MKIKTSKIMKLLRNSHNMTQREVADVLGITRQAYSRYESSSREPNMETLVKLASYYRVSPQVFYIDDIDKPIEATMDIVEIVARYQLKKTISIDSEESSNDTLDRFIQKQDNVEVRNAIAEYFNLRESADSTESKKKVTLKRRIIKTVFIILIFLFTINIGMMSIHLLDSDYQYKILNHSYINAVLPDQNVNQTMYLGIVKIRQFSPDDIEVGDKVVIYSDFGLNEYFIEDVTSVDRDNQTISTTYDDTTVVTNKFIDVYGEYQKDANLLGTIYYSSKFTTGYGFLVLGHLILLSMYYLSFLDIKDR